MKSDEELQDDVMDELRWEPRINAAAIGVSTKQGSVTLTGHVTSYDQKIRAVEAAERVAGATSVADELEVRLSGDPRDDSDVAQAIATALSWSSTVPAAVKAEVKDGWITLKGEADWAFQIEDALRIAQHLKGVQGVTNLIALNPTITRADVEEAISDAEVEDDIRDAIERNADLDADDISVNVSEGTVELDGSVHSLFEANLAESAAWSAPGVHEVIQHLTITP